MTIKFTASDEQIKQLAANAINASTPMGLGILHYNPSQVYQPDDIELNGALPLDYVGGRMVKLWIKKLDGNNYQIHDPAPRIDYQSWAATYSTYQELLASADITAITDE